MCLNINDAAALLVNNLPQLGGLRHDAYYIKITSLNYIDFALPLYILLVFFTF